MGKECLMDIVKIGRDFFDTIHKMNSEELTTIINNEVGAELTSFLQNYSNKVAEAIKDTGALKRSFSTMLILGYLLRGRVDAQIKEEAS